MEGFQHSRPLWQQARSGPPDQGAPKATRWPGRAGRPGVRSGPLGRTVGCWLPGMTQGLSCPAPGKQNRTDGHYPCCWLCTYYYVLAFYLYFPTQSRKNNRAGCTPCFPDQGAETQRNWVIRSESQLEGGGAGT